MSTLQPVHLPNTPGIRPLLSPHCIPEPRHFSSAYLPASTVVHCPHGSPRTFPLTPPSTGAGSRPTTNQHPFKGPPATPAFCLLQITDVLSTSGPHICCALCLKTLFSAGRTVTWPVHSDRSGCSSKGHPQKPDHSSHHHYLSISCLLTFCCLFLLIRKQAFLILLTA